MKIVSLEQGRRILADTTTGIVDQELTPGGVVKQPPDPDAVARVGVVVVAGNAGTAHSETDGAAIVGDFGTASVNRYGIAYAAMGGTAIGGAGVTCVVRDGGMASSGDGGIAIAKLGGEASVNAQGIAIAYVQGGVASAGVGGIIIIGHRDANGDIKFKIGRIGEDGLLPNVRYTLDAGNNFVVAPAPAQKD